ncbi:hypothetical protein DY78_GL000509 [Lactiplantibacillus fabifermentans DSM 21115]|uniref:Uncharacterized protein n=1 Tax=Lactiplantibacillus fabifermentans DSM 21115 TaxID=1413187 RepID=A0A0R2NQD0_9LACO|nr:hypothetical protein DY78_GL000509 [Lactiplantibacillus fabifermentans DSM 21115]
MCRRFFRHVIGVAFGNRQRVMAGSQSALGTAFWPQVYPTARIRWATGDTVNQAKKTAQYAIHTEQSFNLT